MARMAPMIGVDDPALLAAHLMTLDTDVRGRRAAARTILDGVVRGQADRQPGRASFAPATPTLSAALARLPRGDRGLGAHNDDAFLEALEISVQEIRRHLRRLSQLAQRQSQENAA